MNNPFLVIVCSETGDLSVFRTNVISDELLVSTINDGAVIIDITTGMQLVSFELNTRKLTWEDIQTL